MGSKPAVTVSADIVKKSDDWLLRIAHNEESAGKNALISHEFFHLCNINIVTVPAVLFYVINHTYIEATL
jgi:predicted metalloprotease with PDZ domain